MILSGPYISAPFAVRANDGHLSSSLRVLCAGQVMEGLKRLRDREGSLTASSMEAIEQDELASILRSVHWNKVGDES